MGKEENVETVALIPPIQFFKLMDEVEALPLRKRAKWSGSVKDNRGAKRKVYYITPGKLIMRSGSEWYQLKPTDEALHKDLVFDSPKDEEEHRRWIRAYERGGWAESEREHDRIVADNATGNHRSRPHKIRIPTKPGDAVRG
jgi:hypothetical protein